jgi:quercetin dioxygenase-like cupin family protein
MKKMSRNAAVSVLTMAGVMFTATWANAEGDPAGHSFVVPADLKWVPNPALPGAATAVLVGDPKKPGPYVMRIKFPPNTNNLPHIHPDNRMATIISGTWYFGHGDEFDQGKGKALPAGTFFTESANTVHYNFTKSEEVIVQVHGTGPTGTEYLKK